MRAEEADVVVTQHATGPAVAQERDGLIAEAELLHDVARAEQLVDVTHSIERRSQSRRVAVDVGHDADEHDEGP
jgi:hypothetical protein